MRAFFDTRGKPWLVWIGFALVGLSLALLPLAVAQAGTAWVRITNYAILYVMLALGLNIVVGLAGLLDLGYIAFYAVGAYVYALLASPQLGLHLPFWVILPLAALVAAFFGVILGAPTLKLRGDYLEIVTLGFGEIIRIFLNNLSQPVNITNGPRGITGIDPFVLAAMAFRESGFDPFATGAAGEVGIVQLHPRGIGRSVRFIQNERYRERCRREVGACQREVVEVGAAHFAEAITTCGGVSDALGYYNRGICGETDYSRRVLRERERLVELAKTPGAKGVAQPGH